MNVELLGYTNKPEAVVYAAASICYKSHAPMESLFNHCFKSGHLSVFEHATFTFLARGLSRVCTHQLVRHRLASYSQQSLRYTEAGDVYLPPDLVNDRVVVDAVKVAFDAYNNMVAKGVPREVARYVLPNAITSDIVFTMNAREIMHFCNVRLCVRSQEEIRTLASKIKNTLAKKFPLLFNGRLGSSCEIYGFCREANSCNRLERRSDETIGD